MKKLSYLFLLFFIISNCSLNKVQKKHGVRNLQIKQQKLIILESNKNDIKKILGPPSSVSTFDNDLWIFIEREVTHERLIKLGKEKLVKNNVLFLELDSKGILIKKNFYDINEMNETDISSLSTEAKYSKKSFIYDFLSSMRQKINDPLGKRKKP
tara:strand:- start:1107 stop:1571 length:465 start_codon:yes stop_codon:yes gene_type:complete